MRKRINASFESNQPKLGQIQIADIKIDLESRDQIPKILLGLQHFYSDEELLEKAYNILEDEIILQRSVQSNNGRPGMTIWQVLVIGVLRLNNNWDYDHLETMVNSHKEIRLMLGLGIWEEHDKISRKTLMNNFSMISDKAFDQISELVVKAGHKMLDVEDEELKTRVDSFVMESNVHHPTDSNLLMDSVRKIFHVIWFLENVLNAQIIDQSKNELKVIKRLFDKIRKMRHSTSKVEAMKKKRKDAIKEAHQVFLTKVQGLFYKIDNAFENSSMDSLHMPSRAKKIMEMSSYLDYAAYQMDLISRRVFEGETIPQHEKIYSIFEYYTQWIVKGKAKTPVELGLKVAVVDDQYGFILGHQVMHKTIEEQWETLNADEITRKQITDEKITVSFMKDVIEKFNNITSVSFDKGFYAPTKEKELKKFIDHVILPKKGKLSVEAQVSQSTDTFVEGRKRHSGIESSIHALENHGLDSCPDKGLPAFKRYVSCAVLARNLQILGNHIQKKYLEKKALEREKKAA